MRTKGSPSHDNRLRITGVRMFATRGSCSPRQGQCESKHAREHQASMVGPVGNLGRLPDGRIRQQRFECGSPGYRRIVASRCFDHAMGCPDLPAPGHGAGPQRGSTRGPARTSSGLPGRSWTLYRELCRMRLCPNGWLADRRSGVPGAGCSDARLECTSHTDHHIPRPYARPGAGTPGHGGLRRNDHRTGDRWIPCHELRLGRCISGQRTHWTCRFAVECAMPAS